MKLRLLTILAVVFSGVGMTVVYQAAASLDGTNPPHAVDTAGKAIPESSVSQPDKAFIFSNHSNDPKWGEMKHDMTLDHSNHNTEAKQTRERQTPTACAYPHHTEKRRHV